MPGETVLGRAKIPISGDLSKLDADLSQARSNVGRAVDSIAANVQQVGKAALVGVGIVGSAAAGAAVGLGKLAIDAAPVEGLQRAFEGLATASGSSMDEMLSALQRGSMGMVSQRDLMMSYNQASQLVSSTFANQLPDAMGYLSKVSAATGQDMGFMLDSLVKGVGRLSPMILDNLGIQVALSEATERASEMYGVQADELTKAQTQAGMMSVVMEKLAANTAAMPDISDSATTGLAQLSATFQDVKDRVGMALLPILNDLMGTVGELAEKYLPPIFEIFESKIIPVLENVLPTIEDIIKLFTATGDTSDIAMEGLSNLANALGLTDEQFYKIEQTIKDVVTSIKEIFNKVQEFLAPVADWIRENVELEDVLIALGIAIASVVVSVVAAAAPIIATFAALVGAVMLVRKAWEENWGGIRDKLTALWENHLKPALEALWEWLQINIPIALEKLAEFWEETLKPALEKVWAFIVDDLVPALVTIWEWLAENIPPAIEDLARFWEETLKPALEKVWAFITEELIPMFELIVTVVREGVGAAFDWLKTNILEPVGEAFRTIGDAIKDVIDWFRNLIDKIGELKLPDWLTPGSPTPLELGLRGIGKAMRQLSTMQVPQLSMELAAATAAPGMSRPSGEGDLAAASASRDVYTMNVYTQAKREDLDADFQSLRARAGH